ncbi:hypothetical protein [Amycolatopsis sp. NBC_01480]|uniref:hypothetical protein n=1 Tax=Amycolatopsis sp. NBC_01480 TaxID=2903562 RepID=UPI002E2D2BF2|nr:hypothetical protein [Amycolatopsis sp. NBC_01480]
MTVQHHLIDDACAEVGERLAGEFAGWLSPAAVGHIVRAAARDLDGQIVPEALGEMLHRLAGFRIARLVGATHGTYQPSRDHAWTP